MASASRVGTGLLGTFGLALAGLMAYTLAFEGCQGTDPPGQPGAVAAEVAVFFPDRADWSDFRHAVAACVGRGLAVAAEEGEDSVVVATPRLGRRVRFTWDGVRGVGEARAEVARLARRESPPIAVVGSSTTVLTAALADSLREAGPSGPVLLLPWATALRAGREGGEGSPLLEIDRGRTFRFCPNNDRLADSVVDCLLSRDGPNRPGRAFVVVDPRDPYSVDLADGFRRAIRARAPSVEISERVDALGEPTTSRAADSAPIPSAEEARLAEEIWTAAESDGRAAWVVLPLQGEPTRRVFAALQARSSWAGSGGGDGPIRAVCGDAIRRDTLDGLAGRRAFPVWCASTSSAPSPTLGLPDDTQTLAEIVSALLLAVERSPRATPTADDVREVLAGLDLAATDPSAFGRPLAFAAGGERRGETGKVLATRPGRAGVAEFARGAGGAWVEVGPGKPEGRRR